MPIPAIIGGIATIGAGIASAIANKKIAESQAAAQQRNTLALMSQQNMYNEYWWNKYGKPSAMVQQYKEAGLNPYLMYSNGGASGQMASTPSASAGMPNPINFDLRGAADMVQTLALMKAQKENIEADTENKRNDVADNPTIGRYLTERDAHIQNAKSQADAEANKVILNLQDTLTHICNQSFSDAFNITQSESESGGHQMHISLNYNGSAGGFSSDNWNIGVNAGAKGVGLNGGMGEGGGSNSSYGRGTSIGSGKSFAESVLNAHGIMHSESNNFREAKEAIEKAMEELKRIEDAANGRITQAETSYTHRVEQYNKTRSHMGTKSSAYWKRKN